MDINRDNYEEYFLDFSEGNLSAEKEEILNNFLRFNPDLADELKDFDLLKVSVEDIRLPGKESLKKEIPTISASVNARNFEMFSIAYLENDLTINQRELFEDFLNSKGEYNADFKLLKRTYLEAEKITFLKKNSLIRRRRTSIFNLRIILPVAAAATIAILILVKMDPIEINNEIASLPESVILTETADIEPEVKNPKVEERAASIQIIRNSRTSAPVSTLKKQVSDETKETQRDKDLREQKGERTAGIDISRIRITELRAKNDQITTQPLSLPTINMSSLAISERLRYQLDKASDLMNEDDVFIWNLANQGIQEVNKLTGSDMSLMASQDQEGSVSGFQFKSRFFNMIAPLSSERE